MDVPPWVVGDVVQAQRLVERMHQDPQAGMQAARIYERILTRLGPGPYLALRAGVLYNLGSVYAQLLVGDRSANLERAIACLQEAAGIFTPESAPAQYAGVQLNLGEAYRKLPTGDRGVNLAQAIACSREALRFLTPENAPRDYAMVQNNLGLAYAELPTGDQKMNLVWAVECFQEALVNYDSEEAPLKYGRTLSNLGNVLQRRGELQRAIQCFEEALGYFAPGTLPHEYSGIQVNLGTAYADLQAGDRRAHLEKAVQCYTKALRFYTVETMPLEYAGIQVNLANVYLVMPVDDPAQTLEQAIEHYGKALEYYDPHLMLVESRQTGRDLGHLLFTEKRWSQAHAAYDKALKAAERMYAASFMESSRDTEIGENASLYARDAFCLARMDRIPEAIMRLEAGKTLVLSERLARDAVQLQQAGPEDQLDYQRLTDRMNELEARQRDSLAGSEQPAVSGRVYVGLAEQVTQVRRDREALIERICRQTPDFFSFPLDIHSMQALLTDNQTALILPCVTELGSVMFVIQRDPNLTAVWIEDFTQADLRELLQGASDQVMAWFEMSEIAVRHAYPPAWTTVLSEIAESAGQVQAGWLAAYRLLLMMDKHVDHPAREAAETAWLGAVERVLTQVGHRLVAPLYAELQRHHLDRLMIVPYGSLFLLPLAAVPIDQDRTCLLDRYQVSYAPSVKVLQRCYERAACSRSQGLFAIRNPTGDLAFAESEVSTISSYFGETAEVPESTDASKEHVLERASGHGYLHFACHGRYDWEQPYHRSALLLAGSLEKDERGQSVIDYERALTLAEVGEKLDLGQTRLVTLSACETGMSEAMGPRAEEYVGLSAAFLQAGVPAVVSSLWSVPDLSTALLMERFYHNHIRGRMDFAAALREAQLRVRDMEAGEVAGYVERRYRLADRENAVQWLKHRNHYRYQAENAPGSRPFEHPYYWAGFTLNGA